MVLGAQVRGRGRQGPVDSRRVSYLWQDEVQLVEGLPGFLVRNTPDGTIASARRDRRGGAPFTSAVSDLTASLSYEMDNGPDPVDSGGRNCSITRPRHGVRHPPAQAARHLGYPKRPRTVRRIGASFPLLILSQIEETQGGPRAPFFFFCLRI